MDAGLSEQRGKQLRREARQAVEQAREERADELARQVREADLTVLSELQQRLEVLGETWSVHQQQPVTSIPLIGPLLSWLGARLAKFLLQHQIAFNAQVTGVLKEIHQAQRLLVQEQIERTDQLFSYLDERSLALEARIRDLEEEVQRLHQQS